MITKEDLKQEIEQLDPTYLELVLKLLKQFPHHSKSDVLSNSRVIDYGNEGDDNELAFTDVIDAASFSRQLRTESVDFAAFSGILKKSPNFNGDPVEIQRRMRDEWN